MSNKKAINQDKNLKKAKYPANLVLLALKKYWKSESPNAKMAAKMMSKTDWVDIKRLNSMIR